MLYLCNVIERETETNTKKVFDMLNKTGTARGGG